MSISIWSVKCSSMSFELTDSCRAELKQLWGGTKVPPLTPEQIELSLKLWHKIKSRKLREQKLAFSEEDLE
jgi:hypothetical protein